MRVRIWEKSPDFSVSLEFADNRETAFRYQDAAGLFARTFKRHTRTYARRVIACQRREDSAYERVNNLSEKYAHMGMQCPYAECTQ